MNAYSTNADRKPGLAQGIVLLLPVTMAVMGVSILASALPSLIVQFQNVWHTEYLVSILMSLPLLWIVLFSPFAGWLADCYGRRKLLIGAMVVYAIAGTAPIYLNSLWLLFVSRSAVGICISIVLTVSTTLISDYFGEKQRITWLAAQTFVASLSALLIIPLGGLLGSLLGWRGPFYPYAYSLVLVVGVVKYTWEPATESQQKDNSETQTDDKYYDLPWLRLAALCTLTLVSAEMFYGIINQGPRALGELGVHDVTTLGIHAALAILGTPFGTILYRYLSHLKVGLLIFLAFALLGVGLWLFAHAVSPTGYTFAAFITQLGCGIILPTMLVWTTSGLAYNIRSRGHGMWQSAFMAGQMVSSVTISYFSVEFGSTLAAFNVLAMFALLTSIGALIATLYIFFADPSKRESRALAS